MMRRQLLKYTDICYFEFLGILLASNVRIDDNRTVI